jgi:hypothetical protein
VLPSAAPREPPPPPAAAKEGSQRNIVVVLTDDQVDEGGACCHAVILYGHFRSACHSLGFPQCTKQSGIMHDDGTAPGMSRIHSRFWLFGDASR